MLFRRTSNTCTFLPLHLVLVAACLLLLRSHPASANSTGLDQLFDMPLEELINLKITGATLTDKDIRTVPSSVSLFTRAQIEKIGVDYLHELITFVPGFQSFRQGESSNEYYHSARGQRTGTSSREILVLIDGQRFNREFDNAVGVPMISLSNIEKIEFIRGPGSALYGSNAFLGVINITTRKQSNEVGMQYGSNNYNRVNVLANHRFGEVEADLYVQSFNDHGDEYDIQDSFLGTPLETRDPHDGYDVNLNLGIQNFQVSAIHMSRNAEKFYVVENTSNTYNETDNEFSSLQLKHQLQLHNDLHSYYTLAYRQTRYEANGTLAPEGFALAFGGSAPPSLDPLIAGVEQKEKTSEFKFHNDWQFHPQHSLQAGLEYRHSNIDEVFIETNFDLNTFPITYLGSQQPTSILAEEHNRDIVGVYAQSQNAFSDKTELTLGLRYDSYSQIDSALTPRLGLTHQLNNVHTFKVLYGEAFRAPTTNELAFTNNNTLQGNPDLKPETIRTLEFVWLGNWHYHALSVTAFYNEIDDAIVQGQQGSTRIFDNATGTSQFEGLEIEYIADLSQHWQLRSSFSIFNDLPDSSFRQADHLGSIILGYTHEHWGANLAATYNSEREMAIDNTYNYRQSIDSYWLTYAKWYYHFPDGQTLFIQAKNLLDEEYGTPTQGFDIQSPLPNKGRELSIGFAWPFE